MLKNNLKIKKKGNEEMNLLDKIYITNAAKKVPNLNEVIDDLNELYTINKSMINNNQKQEKDRFCKKLLSTSTQQLIEYSAKDWDKRYNNLPILPIEILYNIFRADLKVLTLNGGNEYIMNRIFDNLDMLKELSQNDEIYNSFLKIKNILPFCA